MLQRQNKPAAGQKQINFLGTPNLIVSVMGPPPLQQDSCSETSIEDLSQILTTSNIRTHELYKSKSLNSARLSWNEVRK